jgi:DNA/RNA-binding domain of Phe-tRNA-synthetase-like protein
MAIEISVTDEWKALHADALIGVLELSGVDNTVRCAALEQRKRAVEADARARYGGFSRAQFAAVPVVAEYVRYYKRFEQTYHVLLQLESIVRKGKALPAVSPLVDANFLAEIETLVLTAGHDAARLREPLWIDVAGPGDTMTQMNGAIRSMRPGDMVMRDADGIACSILYGQDNRSPIAFQTNRALYVAYAPAGVTRHQVNAQLDAIEKNVAPECRIDRRSILHSQRAARTTPPE